MTGEDQAFRAAGQATRHRAVRRATPGLVPGIILAGAATLALTLSACSPGAPAPGPQASSLRPIATAARSARPTRSPSATARATQTTRPAPTATTAPPAAAPAPTSVPQPTQVPQQDCFAPPHPTCTAPPPPSYLLHSPYIAPTTRDTSPMPVITETS